MKQKSYRDCAKELEELVVIDPTAIQAFVLLGYLLSEGLGVQQRQSRYSTLRSAFLVINVPFELRNFLSSNDTSSVAGVIAFSALVDTFFAAATMPPKGRKRKASPKPVEFSISQIIAGRRRWVAGSSFRL